MRQPSPLVAARTIARRRSSRPRGFTLIEMMVAMVIALAVVGAMLEAMLASLRNDRHTDAMLQITEDAAFALGVMRQQVAQAGFSAIHGVAPTGLVVHAFPAVFGCRAASFRDMGAGILAPPSCDPSSTDPMASDALEIAYEDSVLAGPASNAILGGRGAGEPLDCLGNSFAKTADPMNGDYYLNDSRFYVAGGDLYCHGPGNPAGGSLVQNVDMLQVRYGMSADIAGAPGSNQVAYYDVAPPPGSPAWADVVAVRLCVQVRSVAGVLDAGSAATLGTYVDCDNVSRQSMDGHLRRTFSTTIVLQNRVR